MQLTQKYCRKYKNSGILDIKENLFEEKQVMLFLEFSAGKIKNIYV